MVNGVTRQFIKTPLLSQLVNLKITFRASIAILQASGLPPYVEPCCPGLMFNIMWSSHSTADTLI